MTPAIVLAAAPLVPALPVLAAGVESAAAAPGVAQFVGAAAGALLSSLAVTRRNLRRVAGEAARAAVTLHEETRHRRRGR